MKILIAEDTASDAYLISASLKILELADLEFMIVKTYEASLKEAQRVPYDLCIFDYHLIGGTGAELLLALKENGVDIPTVIFSGFDDPKVKQQCLDAGAVEYMSKHTAIFSDWGRNLLVTIGRADLLGS